MAPIDRRLKLLSAGSPGTVVRILTEALGHADVDECVPLADALAATGRPGAVAVVIRNLHRLGPDGRRCLRRARAVWPQAFGQVLASGRRGPILNALSVIRSEGDATLVGLLVDRLVDDDPPVASGAARALLEITRREIGPHGRRRPAPSHFAALDAALAATARSYRRHRLEPALLAVALSAARPGPRLERLLDDPEQPITLALSSLLGRETPALVREHLVDWLAVPRLARPAARALARPHAPAALSDILERGHLLLDPARRRVLSGLDRPARCLPAVPASVGLTRPAQARLPLYIEAAGLSPDAAIRKLGQCRRLSSVTARALAVHRLARCGPMARETLGAFAHDADPGIAHAAIRRLRHGPGGLPTSLAERLERSPHAAVARLAGRAAAEAGIDAFFARWRGLPDTDRVAAARRLLVADPARFSEALLAIAVGPDLEARLPALLLARRLRIATPPPPAVLVEVKCPDPRIAATVVAMLGDDPGGSVDPELRRRVIQFGLHHEDARVRANAVEVARPGEVVAEWGTLRGLAGDEENRPRANAIAAVCRRRPEIGLPLLEAMLRDPNPLHRVSAIWAVRRARALSAVDHLRRMARQDGAGVVRRRALRAVSLMTDPDQVAAGKEGS